MDDKGERPSSSFSLFALVLAWLKSRLSRLTSEGLQEMRDTVDGLKRAIDSALKARENQGQLVKLQERMISFHEAALLARELGVRGVVTQSTVWGWAMKGVQKGQLKLRYERAGTLQTTATWVKEFIEKKDVSSPRRRARRLSSMLQSLKRKVLVDSKVASGAKFTVDDVMHYHPDHERKPGSARNNMHGVLSWLTREGKLERVGGDHSGVYQLVDVPEKDRPRDEPPPVQPKVNETLDPSVNYDRCPLKAAILRENPQYPFTTSDANKLYDGMATEIRNRPTTAYTTQMVRDGALHRMVPGLFIATSSTLTYNQIEASLNQMCVAGRITVKQKYRALDMRFGSPGWQSFLEGRFQADETLEERLVAKFGGQGPHSITYMAHALAEPYAQVSSLLTRKRPKGMVARGKARKVKPGVYEIL